MQPVGYSKQSDDSYRFCVNYRDLNKVRKFDQNVFAYLDDLIIISEDLESHLGLLEKVLQTLIDAGLRINRDKCAFVCSNVTELVYL